MPRVPNYNLAPPLSSSTVLGETGGVVKRFATSALLPFVNVRHYGAVGDGVTDDTAAIRSAIARVLSRRVSGNAGIYGSGSVTSGSAPTLLFPCGVYKISDYLTADADEALAYANIVGDDAIIASAAGVVAFGGVASNVDFEGLTFRGGAVAISIKTANADTAVVNVDRCEFQSQTTASMRSDTTSQSTIINVTRSKFYESQAAGGYVGYFGSGDKITFSDCWISCKSPTAFYNGGTAAVLAVKDCLGVPGGDMSLTTGQWVVNYGSVHLENFRMGGESGGSTLVANYSDMDTSVPIDPRFVVIRDCPAYAQFYTVKFYKLPNMFEFTGNHGLVDTDGLYFDAGITQADFANFQRYGILNVDPAYSRLLLRGQYSAQKATGAAVFAAKLIRDSRLAVSPVGRLLESSVYGSGAYSAAFSVDSANCTLASVTDKYGAMYRQATATSDGGYVEWYRTTYLDPGVLTPNKAYTLIFMLEGVTTIRPNIQGAIRIGGATFQAEVSKGRNVFCVPFVYLNDTGTPVTVQDELRVQFYGMYSGDVVQMGRHILVEGFVNWSGEILQLSGTAAPTGYTNGIGSANAGYVRGDISWRSDIAAGNVIGDVCRIAGTPGTWSGFGSVVLQGSATYDPPNLLAGAGTGTTLTVTGAEPGDFVQMSFSNSLQGITMTGWVESADSVSVRLFNGTTGDLDIASGTLRARVQKA